MKYRQLKPNQKFRFAQPSSISLKDGGRLDGNTWWPGDCKEWWDEKTVHTFDGRLMRGQPGFRHGQKGGYWYPLNMDLTVIPIGFTFHKRHHRPHRRRK